MSDRSAMHCHLHGVEWPEEVVERVAWAIASCHEHPSDIDKELNEYTESARAALDALGDERVSALYSDDTGEFLVAGPLHEENKFMVPAVLIKLEGRVNEAQ